jgi:hypothetical protein
MLLPLKMTKHGCQCELLDFIPRLSRVFRRTTKEATRTQTMSFLSKPVLHYLFKQRIPKAQNLSLCKSACHSTAFVLAWSVALYAGERAAHKPLKGDSGRTNKIAGISLQEKTT